MAYEKEVSAPLAPCHALGEIPTPSRRREDDLTAGADSLQRDDLRAGAVCVLDVCPWDSLAQCLTLPELERLCCASASHYSQLTIEEESEVASVAEGKEDSASPHEVSNRKLLAPLMILKIETAEMELERVSIPNIRALRIWNYRSLDALASAVAASGGPRALRSLERLALKGSPLAPELITSFIAPVFTQSRLKHLNMERNQVTDDMICNLVESGALDVASLESLNLRFNKIGSRGAKAIASSACFPNLNWINFKMNQIGDEGAAALAERLHGNSSMRLLNIRRQMPPLTDSTAAAFAVVLRKNNTLEQLRLRQNRIGDVGAAALAKEVSGHVGRLQRTLGFGARFELDLEQNRIKESGAESLLQSLKDIGGSVRVELLLHGNPVSKASLEKAGAPPCEDPRLHFASKAEGLLW